MKMVTHNIPNKRKSTYVSSVVDIWYMVLYLENRKRISQTYAQAGFLKVIAQQDIYARLQINVTFR